MSCTPDNQFRNGLLDCRMSHSLFPLLISRENGGPIAQPAAPSLLFLFDAFNGEGLEIGILVADFLLQLLQSALPPFLDRARALELEDDDAVGRRRAVHRRGFIPPTGEVFATAFFD